MTQEDFILLVQPGAGRLFLCPRDSGGTDAPHVYQGMVVGVPTGSPRGGV